MPSGAPEEDLGIRSLFLSFKTGYGRHGRYGRYAGHDHYGLGHGDYGHYAGHGHYGLGHGD